MDLANLDKIQHTKPHRTHTTSLTHLHSHTTPPHPTLHHTQAVHNDEVKNHYDEPDHPIPGHPTDANGHVLVWDSWNDTVNRSYEIVTATPHGEVLDHVTPNFPAKGYVCLHVCTVSVL